MPEWARKPIRGLVKAMALNPKYANQDAERG
jgi:hypothetical protein